MIKDIKELNFPAYATLETATATIADMGDRTITSQVKIDGDVVPDFSYDWEVEFKGERYIHPVKTPQGTKDNSSLRAKIDLVFQHWAIYEMKRQYFVEMASISAGTAIADKYIASLGLNLGDLVTAFNLVLNHYFGGRIIISLNPEWQYDTEAKFVSISYSYIWDVLQQMHEIYGVRWTLKTNADGVCEILMGYPAEEVSHIFEYGFEGGLLSVQRQVQSTEIRNRLLGRGGSKNLPARYFKDKDPNNPLFEADPDWIPELANIAFTELRGKTFRDYVKGWKAKRYGGTPMDEPTEAYLAGYNAEKFDPIEYVDDNESIEKYGVLVGALENNEEIYPSIQGAPGDVDMIVDAEQVTDDDVDAAVENDSVRTNLESGHQTYRNAPANSTVTIETLTKRYFSVPEGKVGNLDMSLTVTGKYSNVGDYEPTYPILKTETVNITVHDSNTDEIVKSSVAPVVNLPAGDYYYMISADVETNYDKTSMVTLNIESVRLYISTPGVEGWSQTFDIWVRNIWGSSRNAGETDQQYADRVWLPILGDRMGDEARVVFASGWLSFSSDWEFPIVGYAFDDSKTGSHWRLTLAKSEAEKDAGRPFVPYEGYNASAGDRFFFIGIDMPWQYVYWGEERIDDYKRDTLPETARINPSWVIKTDKVRLNQNREGAKLIDSLSVGAQIRLASKQFIAGAYETLYVQSLTYNWIADTILYPDVEVVVSDKVHTVKNPVAQIQSSIDAIQRQVGSMSNIQQIIRQVCDKIYLRKDGVSDISKSPTKFLGKVTGEKFRQGQIGGRDWGIYRDENGNAIFEADKFVARQGILVSDLVVNEATYVGGLQINSAASLNVKTVNEAADGYVCFFDQKQGSVTNKFKIDDIVLCQKYDADQSVVKFYKARVIALGDASVTLSKTDINGTGIPAENDVIIQYGNYSDKTRQYVIVRDVIGGGYERMLMGLDSVESDGVEYYFAGKSADSTARWFVGGTEQFAKYEGGQLTIKGNIFVTGSDKNISEQLAQIDFIREAFGENAQGLVLGTAIIVGYSDENENFVPMAGLSGVYDKDAENGGPAAWYGGTPDDAKSVIFMDGTGYFADGLFSWDKTKGINLGNDAIKINYDGSIDFGGNIRIGSTGEETLDSLLTIVAGLTEMWEIDSKGNLVTDKQVIIKNNLIVEGDTASGGEGGGSSVGIQGIVINGTTYRDTDGDGLIDLGEITGGLTEITSAMITEALGYTPVNPLALGNLATKDSVAWSEITNVLTGGDEFNIIPSGHNGVFLFNHRAKDGGSGTITEYRMRNGAGSYAPVRAFSFIVHGGTSSQFLKADGSLDSTSYLSTAGGTIESTNANTPLSIKGGGDWVGIEYYNNSSKLGYLGIWNDHRPIFIDASRNVYDLLHSGNIESQSVDKATRLRTLVGSDVPDIDTLSFADWSIRWYSNIPSSLPNLPTHNGYQNGLLVFPLHSGGTTAQMYMTAGNYLGFRGTTSGSWKQIAFTDSNVASADYATNAGGIQGSTSSINFARGHNRLEMINNISSYGGDFATGYQSGISVITEYVGWQMTSYGGNTENPYFRSLEDTGRWKPWRRLAFLDDNVASATKLATLRTIWGQSFDGTADIWGNLNLHSDKLIFNSDASNYFISCQGTSLATYNMYGGHSFCTLGGTQRMLINSSGNVLIGTTSDSGYRLKVEGTTYHSTELYLANWAYLASYKTDGSRLLMVGLDNNNLLTINQSGSGVNTAILGGNVGIGTTNPQHKLDVNGDISMPNNHYIAMGNTAGAALYQMWMTSNDVFFVGRGSVENGHDSVYCGKTIRFSAGNSAWNNSGTFDEYGNFHLTGAVTMSSNLNVGGVATIGNTISANRDASTGAIHNSALAAWKAECYASYVRWSVYKGDGTAAYNPLYLADNGNVGIDCNPSFKLHVNGTAKINDIVRLGANLYVSQDSTAYGLRLWGDADGGYLGVHAKGSFKSANMRFGYDGSATVYGNLVVQGDISA